jgi:predicted RNase H-like HicB family nuclease
MKFIGHIEKDKKSKYWAIGVEDLAIFTQGTSRDDAFNMLRDAIQLLAEDEVEAPCEIDIEDTGEKTFYLSFKDTKAMWPFIIGRLKYSTDFSVAEISEKLGKASRTTVGRYVSGSSIPTIPAFDELLKALGYDLIIKKKG